jgi:hypothetical protein
MRMEPNGRRHHGCAAARIIRAATLAKLREQLNGPLLTIPDGDDLGRRCGRAAAITGRTRLGLASVPPHHLSE